MLVLLALVDLIALVIFLMALVVFVPSLWSVSLHIYFVLRIGWAAVVVAAARPALGSLGAATRKEIVSDSGPTTPTGVILRLLCPS